MIARDLFADTLAELAATKAMLAQVRDELGAMRDDIAARRKRLAEAHRVAIASSRGRPTSTVMMAAAALGELNAVWPS